jgi:hypothetical protein
MIRVYDVQSEDGVIISMIINLKECIEDKEEAKQER